MFIVHNLQVISVKQRYFVVDSHLLLFVQLACSSSKLNQGLARAVRGMPGVRKALNELSLQHLCPYEAGVVGVGHLRASSCEPSCSWCVRAAFAAPSRNAGRQ